MKEVVINDKTYILEVDEKEGFNLEEVTDKLTEYFDEFDIIVGDIAYGKLRLKGFNEKENQNFKAINDAAKIEDYIKNNCAYGCKWFKLRRK